MSDEYKVVSRFVFDPSRSIIKFSANQKAECTTIWCSLPECPIRESGGCILLTKNCPYGKKETEVGWTKRARKHYEWINKKREEYPGVPALTYPKKKLAFIGDYVYLPYSFMDMNEDVPFLRHSSPFVPGKPFLPREEWTIQAVLSMLDFRPQAIMGGEITDYQKKEVPKFLAHLQEEDGDMWGELVNLRPELDVEPDYVGRKAYLGTLNNPIRWTTSGTYQVEWEWDGEELRTSSPSAYSSIFGKIALDKLEIRGVPNKDATIVVKDNAWVNEGTKFAD